MQMEGPVEVLALINGNSVAFGSFSPRVVCEILDCMVSVLGAVELVNSALELLVMAYAASEAMVLPDQYVEHIMHYFVEICPKKFSDCGSNFINLLLQSAYARSARQINQTILQGLTIIKEGLPNDEVERSCDECKASANDMLLHGPAEGPNRPCCGNISDWTVSAARGKDEVNSNHSKAGKPVASGKGDNSNEDDEDEEDDEDVQDEGESGDEEDDGEGEDDGNEDEDEDEEEEEEDEDDEEEEEEDDEEDVIVAHAQSARGNLAPQNEEEDDDSDEGEGEEEGVEDEDEFGDEGEDEDGEENEEDEEEEEEDVPEPPRKKNKSS